MTAFFAGFDLKKQSMETHRSYSPQETLDRVSPMMAEFGITRIACITGLDRIGLPVTLAIRPNSRSVAVSQGKGKTLVDAKVSALMETIEIWHAEHFSAPVFYGRVRDLEGSSSFPDLERIAKPAGSRFSDSTPIPWVNAIELNSSKELLVPFEMVHADYTYPGHAAQGYFPASTNGLSSGNHILEATCHAITEVVERDALSVWHHTPATLQQRRRLNLDSVSDDACNECLEMIKAADLECGVWDITTDTGIPCYLCLIHEPQDSNNHMGLGSGCHPDRGVALRRAITEAAQTRLNYISGARDDLALDEYSDHGRNSKRSYAETMLSSTDCPRNFDDLAEKQHESILEDLNWMLTRLEAVGIDEVCMVDLTQEKFGIPVVRIIIPGLEAPHDESSYLPGPRARAAESSESVP